MFKSFFLVAVLFGALGISAIVANKDFYPRPTIHNIITRRDDLPSTASFQVGPLSNYQATIAAAPTATGNAISIVPRQTKSDGLDIYLGPDLCKGIDEATQEHCTDVKNPDCIASISKLFNTQQIGIQARAVGLDDGIAAYIAYLVALWVRLQHSMDSTPVHVHLPASDVSQINAATSSSALLFATATDDTHKIAVTLVPSTDQSGYTTIRANGDLDVILPEGLAKILDDYIGNELGCSHSKRDLSFPSVEMLACVGRDATQVVNRFAHDFTINIWAMWGPILRPRIIAALTAYNVWLKDVQPVRAALQGVNQQHFETVATAIYWLVYIRIVLHENINKITTIRAGELEDDPDCPPQRMKCSDTACEGKDGRCTKGPSRGCRCDQACPAIDRWPDCTNCGGDAGNAKCKGKAEYQNLWAGCDCVAGNASIGFAPYKTQREFLDARSRIHLLLVANSPSPKCDRSRATMETAMFQKLISKFCENTSIGRPLIAQDIDERDYTTYNFNFSWESKSSCNLKCARIFNAFLDSSTCSFNSHSMSTKGEIDKGCITAKYSITIKPPFSPGTCSLHLWIYDQWKLFPRMRLDDRFKNDRYSITIYMSDAENNLLGGAPRTVAGDPNALLVKSKLENVLRVTPEEWDEYIQFNLGDMAWRSDNVGGDPRAHCTTYEWDQNEAKRQIDCAFACDYNGGSASDKSFIVVGWTDF